MWTLSKDGFISVVRYDPSKDVRKDSPFPKIAPTKGTHFLIRARVQEHLEPMRELQPDLVIVEDRAADYRWRAVVPVGIYKAYLVKLVDEIDYDSHFKEAMRRAQPSHLAEAMYSAAMSTWTNFMAVQSRWGSGPKPNGVAPTQSAKSYQREKGVRPFREEPTRQISRNRDQEKVRAFEATLSRRILDEDYVGIMEFRDYLYASGRGEGSPRVNLNVPAQLKTALDDEAFELLRRLQSKYGLYGYVGIGLVDKAVEALEAEASA